MYHSANHSANLSTILLRTLPKVLLGASLAFVASSDLQTLAKSSQFLAARQTLSASKSDYPPLPSRREVKKKPKEVVIYQLDSKPLAQRKPFLFVHGLRGEYYEGFRWLAVAKHFESDPTFAKRYKVYFARYDSTAPIENTVPKFKAALDKLYHDSSDQAITITALSMGGNLVYEALVDPDANDKVRAALTMGTPFHGSPLFCEDWMMYSLYNSLTLPIARLDHALAYKLYFGRHPNLLEDLRWDDADGAIPERGKFRSRLPFGPSGNLTVERTENPILRSLNDADGSKKKLITYAAYLTNEYQRTDATGYIERALSAPATLLFVSLPAHVGREHPVLRWLNHQISTVVTTKAASQRSGTPFVYVLNDGITPVTSALFLPPTVLQKDGVVKDNDVTRLKDQVDVRFGRVFKNADHLTFIDGFRPLGASALIKDELNPAQREKHMFDWILQDIMDLDAAESTLATQSPATVSEKTD